MEDPDDIFDDSEDSSDEHGLSCAQRNSDSESEIIRSRNSKTSIIENSSGRHTVGSQHFQIRRFKIRLLNAQSCEIPLFD